MKRKRPDGSFYLIQSIWLNQKSPDAEIPSPEVTQVAGPAVTDNATPKMERKSKSFEPSLTYARDAEILSRKMKGKRPGAAIRYSTLCRGVVQYLTDEFTVRKNKAEKVVTAEIINLEGGQDPPTNGANSTAPITPPVPAPTAPPAPPAEAVPMVAPQSTEEGHLDTNQRQQNDADQEQQNGQIGPWDPGIRLAEEPDSDHKSTTPSGTSGLQVQSLTC